jgi:hypothetical protein
MDDMSSEPNRYSSRADALLYVIIRREAVSVLLLKTQHIGGQNNAVCVTWIAPD